MAVEQPRVIDPDDLTDADKAILDELQHGARTKKYLVEKTGLHRNTVKNRLDVLEAGDGVAKLHDTTALYELADDPREDGAESDVDESELRARLQDALEAREEAQATADRLEAELEDCREELERARASDINTAAIRRAVDDLEAACERGDSATVRDAIERLREAIGDG